MSKLVKLQALECMASPSFLIQPGDIFERDQNEANDLVAAKLAIIVHDHDEPEHQTHTDEKPHTGRKTRGHK